MIGLAASCGWGPRLQVAPGIAYQSVTAEYPSKSQDSRICVPNDASMSNRRRVLNGIASRARVRVQML